MWFYGFTDQAGEEFRVGSVDARGVSSLRHEVTRTEGVYVIARTGPSKSTVNDDINLFRCVYVLKGAGAELVLGSERPTCLSFLIRALPRRDLMICRSVPSRTSVYLASDSLVFYLSFGTCREASELRNALTTSETSGVLVSRRLGPSARTFSLAFSRASISSATRLLFRVLVRAATVTRGMALLPRAYTATLVAKVAASAGGFTGSIFPSAFEVTSSLLTTKISESCVLSGLCGGCDRDHLELVKRVVGSVLAVASSKITCIILSERARLRCGITRKSARNFIGVPLSVTKIHVDVFLGRSKRGIEISVESGGKASTGVYTVGCFGKNNRRGTTKNELVVPTSIRKVKRTTSCVRRFARGCFARSRGG